MQGEEEPVEVDIADKALTNADEWRSFVDARDKIVEIAALVWDLDAKHGQNRKLNNNIIRYYFQKLMASGDPVSPVPCLLKATAGVPS